MKRKMIILSSSFLLLFILSCQKEKSIVENDNTLTTGSKSNSSRTLADVSVPLGGNIQTAIDQVAASGEGTVNLAAGTYYITQPLKIKSGVTLNGKGNPTTTINGTSGNFNVIMQYAEGLSNVTIQNLKIVGTQHQSCYGILLEALTTYHSNIKLINVQVTSAGMGVHLKRVNGITITNCNFHHNAAPGKEKYFHNLYIRSTSNVSITNTDLNNSGTGNGLNVSFCTNVSVNGCNANNNYFRGMRAADTNGFTVKSSTILGNGDIGLLANQEGGVITFNINWDGNIVNNNTKGGIQAQSGSTGTVKNHTATGNGIFNYSIASGITTSNNN